ncbi:MAG: hypothetical protein ABI091_11935 [Ferruginibacter sp.]
MFFRISCFIIAIVFLAFSCIYAIEYYSNADFGSSFELVAFKAEKKLEQKNKKFIPCAALANTSTFFMQAIVFPELMRYSTLKDDIETESLRTLYVQFGPEYADFSIGVFQMKPSFATQVEKLAKHILPDSIYGELKLQYEVSNEIEIRRNRVVRLMEEDWQLVYLTAFVCICDKIYEKKIFAGNEEKLQWYATVYNAGFNRSTEYLETKVRNANFYLEEQMPGKKFSYATIATWYYQRQM